MYRWGWWSGQPGILSNKEGEMEAEDDIVQIYYDDHVKEGEMERVHGKMITVKRMGKQTYQETEAGWAYWYKADEVDAELARLREALEEIAKGEGPYNMDPLKHAENCIKYMVQTATEALKGE
jgi:hypothetical protein